MIRVFPIFLFLTGCTYFGDRARDFGDCWRAEGSFFMTGGAWVHGGPILHGGLGSVEWGYGPAFGWRYGYPRHDYTHSLLPAEGYGLWYHQMKSGNSRDPEHRCFVLLPPLLCDGDGPENWLHQFDLEVGGGFLLGLNLGFSPGEFLDFLLGWFGVDLAGDDPEERRKTRDYFRDRKDRDPSPETPAP